MSRVFAAQEDRLHEAAMAATGLTDFGDPLYREGLGRLLAARDASGIDYPDDGAAVLGGIEATLVARLRTIDRLKQLPGGPAPVDAPIFVLGLPRTGTTAMQRLLMADPRNQGLEYWLGADPQPRPPRERWASDPSYRACVAALDAMHEAAPGLAAMHPMAAEEGEECRLVMEQGFAHSSFSLVAPLRPYQDWLFAADLAPHYRHFKAALGLIGHNDRGRTWVLKCPHHAPQVDSLLRAFPDARLIWMHRHVEELIASVARLSEAYLPLVEGPGLDMTARAQLIIENVDLTLRRLLAARKANPGAFLDLAMDSFVADPITTVAQVYRHFGIALPAASEAALHAWCAVHHQRSGATRTLGQLPYGLQRDALRERFSYYQG